MQMFCPALETPSYPVETLEHRTANSEQEWEVIPIECRLDRVLSALLYRAKLRSH